MSDPNTIEIETLRELISGFFDYFVPKGGVSVVPRGPFSRAIEHMGGCENCGGDPFQHKDWCEEPTPYDDIVEDGGLPEAREAAAAWTPDPNPVESAEEFLRESGWLSCEECVSNQDHPTHSMTEVCDQTHAVRMAARDATIRAERDDYWKGKMKETLSGTWANGWAYCNAHPTVRWTGVPILSRARADWVNAIMAEVLGDDDGEV